MVKSPGAVLPTASKSSKRTSPEAEPAGKRRRGEGREQILRAAREVFAERGYTKASTKEIAARSGYVEILIFRYFGNKANLFTEAVIEPFQGFVDDFFAELAQRTTEGVPTEVLFGDYVAHLYELIRENRGLLLAVLTAQLFEPEALGDALSGLSVSDSLGRLAVPAQLGQEALGLRKSNAEVMVRVMFGMIVGVAITEQWIMPQGKAAPKNREIVDEMTSLFLYGQTPPERSKDMFKVVPGLGG